MLITLVLLAIIFIGSFFAASLYMKKIKNNPAFAEAQAEIEKYTIESQLNNGKAITEDFVKDNPTFNDIKQKLNGEPIEAIINCQYMESLSGKVKSEAKNLLIGALTNTHYKQAHTTEVMVLSGKFIHLFVTAHKNWDETLKGPKEQHIVYAIDNMSDAVLSGQASTTQKLLHSNKVGFQKDSTSQILTFTGNNDKSIAFALYPMMSFGTKPESASSVINGAQNMEIMVERHKKSIDLQIIPLYFIEQLTKRIPGIERALVE